MGSGPPSRAAARPGSASGRRAGRDRRPAERLRPPRSPLRAPRRPARAFPRAPRRPSGRATSAPLSFFAWVASRERIVSRIMASVEPSPDVWPIRFADVLAAERRIRRYVPETPLRRYAPLDAAAGLALWVKHENHAPTNSFKVRNAFSAMTCLSEEQRRRGVVVATRGNHGLGVAYAGSLLGVRTAICVPLGNNPEKNEGIRGYGAEL